MLTATIKNGLLYIVRCNTENSELHETLPTMRTWFKTVQKETHHRLLSERQSSGSLVVFSVKVWMPSYVCMCVCRDGEGHGGFPGDPQAPPQDVSSLQLQLMFLPKRLSCSAVCTFLVSTDHCGQWKCLWTLFHSHSAWNELTSAECMKK